MEWQQWLTLGVSIVTIVLLVRDTVGPSVAVLGAVVTLMVAGVLSAEQALAGFSNAAPVTVAALYVIARGVEKTGGLTPLLGLALGSGDRVRTSLARLLVPAAAASAFLNNTPIVAMLVAPLINWAERRRQSPSTYLMPLAFAVSLGGVVTAIGTSTNLVVSGMMSSSGMQPIGLFELGAVGLPIAVVGILYLVFLSPVILRGRGRQHDVITESVREFAMQVIVDRGGPIDGCSVEDAKLRHLAGVFLVAVERDGESIAPVAPDMLLHGGDRLTFVGRADGVLELQHRRGLTSAEHVHLAAFDSARHTFVQAVIGMESPLVGKTLRDADFREHYQAAVVAIHRAGQRVNEKLGALELRPGDTLVLLTDRGFGERWRNRDDFLLVTELGAPPPAVVRRGWVAVLVTLGVVVVAGAGFMPILQAALVGAGLMVVTGVLTPAEARQSVDLDVILMIAGSIGIGKAIEVSGLADLLAAQMIAISLGGGAIVLLSMIVFATVVITELISNNSAAALMYPIAVASATQLGVDPRGFAIAVAVSASLAFLTPIGYQTNMMVYGPGGYRFGDYARLGLPLTILMMIMIVLVIPLRWPF